MAKTITGAFLKAVQKRVDNAKQLCLAMNSFLSESQGLLENHKAEHRFYVKSCTSLKHPRGHDHYLMIKLGFSGEAGDVKMTFHPSAQVEVKAFKSRFKRFKNTVPKPLKIDVDGMNTSDALAKIFASMSAEWPIYKDIFKVVMFSKPQATEKRRAVAKSAAVPG